MMRKQGLNHFLNFSVCVLGSAFGAFWPLGLNAQQAVLYVGSDWCLGAGCGLGQEASVLLIFFIVGLNKITNVDLAFPSAVAKAFPILVFHSVMYLLNSS